MARRSPQRLRTPLRLPVLRCLICCLALASALPVDAADPSWEQLPPLPDRLGVASACAGVSGGALIVAGGANFPEGPPRGAGRKVWHADAFVGGMSRFGFSDSSESVDVRASIPSCDAQRSYAARL